MIRYPRIPRLLVSLLMLLALLPSAGGLLLAAEEPSLIVMLEAPPKTLDPFFAADAAGVRISHQLIFDTLVRLDGRLEVVPGLAKSWERLSPTRYRFSLRPGVRFHNGAPLTADDLVYTLQSLMSPELGSPYGPALRDKIESVKQTGPLTAEVRLKAPYAAILHDLLLPVRSRVAGPDKPLVGTGPYIFESQGPGEIVLTRNPEYHGGPAGTARIVFKVIRDDNTRLLKLRKGTVDLAINVLPLDKLPMFEQSPLKERFTVVEGPGLSYQYLGFNMRDPALSNKLVRRAIAHAIDIDALITHRQKGHAVRGTGLFPPGSPFEAPGLKPYRHDPALAAELLEEAGYPMRGGKRLSLTYKTSTDRGGIIRARIIQSDLRKAGIEMSVRSYEWGTFYGDISKGNFQLFSLRWIGVTDPDFFYELFHSTRTPPDGRNRGFYANPELDGLLERGRLETDPAKRLAIYHGVSRLLHEELPYISLWHNNNVAIVSKAISGFKLHPTGGFEFLPLMSKASP